MIRIQRNIKQRRSYFVFIVVNRVKKNCLSVQWNTVLKYFNVKHEYYN